MSRGKSFVWNELSDYVKHFAQNKLGDKYFSTHFSNLPFLYLAIEKSVKSQNLKSNILYEPHITKVPYYHTNVLVSPVQPSLNQPQVKLPVVIKIFKGLSFKKFKTKLFVSYLRKIQEFISCISSHIQLQIYH